MSDNYSAKILSFVSGLTYKNKLTVTQAVNAVVKYFCVIRNKSSFVEHKRIIEQLLNSGYLRKEGVHIRAVRKDTRRTSHYKLPTMFKGDDTCELTNYENQHTAKCVTPVCFPKLSEQDQHDTVSGDYDSSSFIPHWNKNMVVDRQCDYSSTASTSHQQGQLNIGNEADDSSTISTSQWNRNLSLDRPSASYTGFRPYPSQRPSHLIVPRRMCPIIGLRQLVRQVPQFDSTTDSAGGEVNFRNVPGSSRSSNSSGHGGYGGGRNNENLNGRHERRFSSSEDNQGISTNRSARVNIINSNITFNASNVDRVMCADDFYN